MPGVSRRQKNTSEKLLLSTVNNVDMNENSWYVVFIKSKQQPGGNMYGREVSMEECVAFMIQSGTSEKEMIASLRMSQVCSGIKASNEEDLRKFIRSVKGEK